VISVPSSGAATKDLLESRNRIALREIAALEVALTGHSTAPFLAAYRTKLLQFAQQCRQQAQKNLHLLSIGIDELLDDIRSWTALVLENVRVATQLLAGPLLRASKCDRLPIKIVSWIHSTNPRSALMPAVCRDGDPAVLPLIDFTPIYQFPTLKQESLLYLPLYFHEFGHVIYAIHRPEMDELVKELQDFILDKLQPMSHRNDLRAKRQRELQTAVAVTWYAWTQELFCDAVGLLMAGPAYGYAFSEYLLRLDRGDFCLERLALAYSSHPITWLRIKFLVSRARVLGYTEMASELEYHWSSVADSLGVIEDFFGFFESPWMDKIEKTLGDMLIETSPCACTNEEALAEKKWSPESSPVLLLNRAWQMARTNPDSFLAWETSAIADFLK
jgi:hypothetical protein